MKACALIAWTNFVGVMLTPLLGQWADYSLIGVACFLLAANLMAVTNGFNHLTGFLVLGAILNFSGAVTALSESMEFAGYDTLHFVGAMWLAVAWSMTAVTDSIARRKPTP